MMTAASFKVPQKKKKTTKLIIEEVDQKLWPWRIKNIWIFYTFDRSDFLLTFQKNRSHF